MKDNPKLCKELLANILDIPVGDLHFVKEQFPISLMPDKKGVRFDIYVNDDTETVYDIEMQNVKGDNLPKRSRYYQSMIDTDLLKKNAKYNELNKSYVIFICNFDLFDDGLVVYNFENRCIDDLSIRLGDESYKVFVNLTAELKDISPALRSIINYMVGHNDSSDIAKSFDDAVSQVKALAHWRHEYMTLQEITEQAKEEGRNEGRNEGRVIEIFTSVQAGDYSISRGAEKLGLTIKAFEKSMTEAGFTLPASGLES